MLDAIVIGAGPAGLATSQQLGKVGLRHRVLERGPSVGHSWRNYYESLVLHTGKHGSSLPGMPFGQSITLFPSRTNVIEYLETYASRFKLPIDFDTPVMQVTHEGSAFVVQTSRGSIEARAVVVATGTYSNPLIPRFDGDTVFEGRILHSAEYRRPEPFLQGKTLVVGAGNSGADIAAELAAAGAAVSLSVRGGVAVQPLMLLGIPLQYWGILLHRLPSPVGLGVANLFRQIRSQRQKRSQILPPLSGPLPAGRVPIIGNRLILALKSGKVRLRPGIDRFEKLGVRFSDGAAEDYSTVILATGYRPAIGFLNGMEAGTRGLFFVGMNNSLAGTLWHIRHEAQRIPRAVQAVL